MEAVEVSPLWGVMLPAEEEQKHVLNVVEVVAPLVQAVVVVTGQ